MGKEVVRATSERIGGLAKINNESFLKMKTLHIFTAIFFFLSLFGCKPKEAPKPKETALSGQVFIVTRGAENIKLGLVEVQLIGKKSIQEFIQKRQSDIDAEIVSRENSQSSAKSDFEQAQMDYEIFQTNNPMTKPSYTQLSEQRFAMEGEMASLKQQYIATNSERVKLSANAEALSRGLQSAIELFGAGSTPANKAGVLASNANNEAMEYQKTSSELLEKNIQFKYACDAKINMLNFKKGIIEQETAKQKGELLEQIAAAKSKLESATTSYEHCPKAEAYFDGFVPMVFQEATTDADGRFLISYPRDKALAIFAKAERLVGSKTEKYYWLIDAPSGTEKAQLFLSNNNLVSIDPDDYFKIKPKSEIEDSTMSQPPP